MAFDSSAHRVEIEEKEWAEALLLLAEEAWDTRTGAETIRSPRMKELLRAARELAPEAMSAHSAWWLEIISDREHMKQCRCGD